MFIVLYPHSKTNNSDSYRVVDNQEWVSFVNGAKSTYAYLEFDTYWQAEEARDKAEENKS